MDLWEPNMASPFGDVSNSDRDPGDLPVLKKTYTVYCGSGELTTQAKGLPLRNWATNSRCLSSSRAPLASRSTTRVAGIAPNEA